MPAQEAVNIWTLTDLTTPWCIHVVATLHIAEHIAADNVDIADLAQAADCDAYALHRVLTHLARLYPLLSRRGHSGSDKGFKPLVQEYRYLL